jgi:tetratricopeptide (TPR) repeat protein
VVDQTVWSGVLLQLARLLVHRAQAGSGDSIWKDTARARDLALRARTFRRAWRGDSAEAVVVAAEAMSTGDDPEAVWEITRPAPDGTASEDEASDPRVLPFAAIAAALTGRRSKAERLVEETTDQSVKLEVAARILTLQKPGGDRRPGIEAWRRVVDAATTDEQRLRAVRALAFEGASYDACADKLRTTHAEAMAEIDVVREIAGISGSDADSRLRRLEQISPLASLRRAELLRAAGDLKRAAQILVNATQRWNEPRLLLLAIDCHIEDGDWPGAKAVAHQALTDAGVLWPGRASVLRRLVDVNMAMHDWTGAMSACRSLLELDDRDEDARWNLAICQHRDGSPEEAFQTLQRHGRLHPTTPLRAKFMLDLVRRFCDAAEVARTALAQLRSFPRDEALHLAAMNAINTRIDQTELVEEVGQDVAEAWTIFFERYPDSNLITSYSLQDDTLPPDMETMMRGQAAGYQKILRTVTDDVLPVGLLCGVTGKPYAALFPYRPLGVHRIASPSEQDILTERQHARAAADGECVVDASALFTLGLIPDIASALAGLIERPLCTAAGLADLLAADDYFSLPTVGTMGFDPEQDRFFINDTDPATRARQQQQVNDMLSRGRSLRRVAHSNLEHFSPSLGDPEPPWMLNVDAAKTLGGVLWCDDFGLRRLAHSYGIPTFGTASLLEVAVERSQIDEASHHNALQALAREYCVDFPFDPESLIDLAGEQQWQPGPVAAVLGRPAAWEHAPQAAAVVLAAVRHATAASSATWIYQAFCGLNAASAYEHRENNLIELSTTIARQPRARPEHLAGIVSAVEHLVPDLAADITDTLLKALWRRILEQHTADEAVLIMVYLVCGLDDLQRQQAMQIVLQHEQTERRPKSL